MGHSGCRRAAEGGWGRARLVPIWLTGLRLGTALELGAELPDESVDVLVTSPPYWGQRMSAGMGVEEDPREYVKRLVEIFRVFKPKVKRDGIVWVNIGDAYNTPVNWRPDDRDYSSLGPGKTGLDEDNSAYIKPRAHRKAYLRRADAPWLTYGNLLALPYRMVIGMCDDGWLLRGEVIWRKKNPMPEGRCRRPHRAHESIYLFATSEKHAFLTDPPVKSVWEFSNERMAGPAHYSRFPVELPRRCVSALGRRGQGRRGPRPVLRQRHHGARRALAWLLLRGLRDRPRAGRRRRTPGWPRPRGCRRPPYPLVAFGVAWAQCGWLRASGAIIQAGYRVCIPGRRRRGHCREKR